MTGRRVLVVGCRVGNLGDAIATAIQADSSFSNAMVYRTEHPERMSGSMAQLALDLTDRKQCVRVLEETAPTDIVCCAGINLADGDAADTVRNFSLQLQANAWGPVQLLSEALDYWRHWSGTVTSPVPLLPSGLNFVAVSSNSAHIARSDSAGYCASKAALSMALRCVARKVAREDGAVAPVISVWGYEPGWIDDTPMSEECLDRLAGWHGEAHRIPGGAGLSKTWLAGRIVRDLADANYAMNGCMIRIDGGEQ